MRIKCPYCKKHLAGESFLQNISEQFTNQEHNLYRINQYSQNDYWSIMQESELRHRP